MKFPAKLKALREGQHLTQEQLANHLGISKSAISMYEQGNRQPDFETLEAIADHFNVDMNFLLGDTRTSVDWGNPILAAYAGAEAPTRKNVCKLLDIPYLQPLAAQEEQSELLTFDLPSAAGLPGWVGSDFEIKAFPKGVIPAGATCAVRISGQSMEPTIPDGSYVFLRKTTELRSGDIGVFMLDGGAVCKRYHKDAHRVTLLSDNNLYPHIELDAFSENASIVGKVIGGFHPFAPDGVQGVHNLPVED